MPVHDLTDPRRSEPGYLLGERQMLEAWLEFHRTTLLLKCERLDDARRKARPLPSSLLSLHGLVRHMAEVERHWFSEVLAGAREPASIWCSERGEEDFADIGAADWDADLATWAAECETSRLAAAGRALDDTGTRRAEQVSLRWIYVHMVEEYARHNGHADLLREMADGDVGW